mmetsp:Transcript_13898/g.25105  ORF Transcript_13898/g.25105 Transcript_13898/m.25105 type:complete len:318 (-) Transcript_13898:62-1015(-)
MSIHSCVGPTKGSYYASECATQIALKRKHDREGKRSKNRLVSDIMILSLNWGEDTYEYVRPGRAENIARSLYPIIRGDLLMIILQYDNDCQICQECHGPCPDYMEHKMVDAAYAPHFHCELCLEKLEDYRKCEHCQKWFDVTNCYTGEVYVHNQICVCDDCAHSVTDDNGSRLYHKCEVCDELYRKDKGGCTCWLRGLSYWFNLPMHYFHGHLPCCEVSPGSPACQCVNRKIAQLLRVPEREIIGSGCLPECTGYRTNEGCQKKFGCHDCLDRRIARSLNLSISTFYRGHEGYNRMHRKRVSCPCDYDDDKKFEAIQ